MNAIDQLIELIGKRIEKESKSFSPPEGVRSAARRALAMREKQPPSNRCCTPVGLARARDLSNGKSVSFATIKRMKAYFDRHQVDKKGGGWGNGSKGEQAWLAWGGDAGYSWAKKIVAQEESK
jgi:hypothetical protein